MEGQRMERQANERTCKRIGIRVSPEEYNYFQERFKATTCRTFSEFVRDILNKKPITIRHRNESADDFLAVAINLKNELNTIAKNFEQAVQQLRQVKDQPGLHQSIQNLEANVFSFQQKADEIK